MAVSIGSQLGTYEITELLGKGGMGEVYRAKDKKLKRDVAIKILPDEFSTDHDRLTRFQREAEVLASLNHPNIAAIYDLAAQDQSQFLVLELVEGETLADRIARGPIPVEEALKIAKQICEALEAAHEKGLIHRDLKPGNIMLSPEGTVKVLDFGLAKVFESQAASNLSNSPTFVSAISSPGIIVGTASYMSPEQAKGRPVDKRTDIFALGCVLYEMLTGRPAFEGDDASEILSAVIRMEPDWTRLPANVSLGTRNLLALCLEKNARNRRSDATDVRIDLTSLIHDTVSSESAYDGQSTGSGRTPWIIAAVMTLSFASLAAIHFREKAPILADKVTFTLDAPLQQFPMVAISPDGKRLAVGMGGTQPIWLRTLEHLETQSLVGTEGAIHPFWSADGHSIGFFAGGKLKKISVLGGPPQSLCDAVSGVGGSWNRNGVIIFQPGGSNGLFRVSADGGVPEKLTELDSSRQETSHRFPAFLPDDKHFLFLVRSNTPRNSGIYVGSLDSKERKFLVSADYRPEFAPPDHILYVRDGALMAQAFDPTRLELRGEIFRIAENIAVNPGNFAAGFTASQSGTLAYRAGMGGAQKLIWLDHDGKSAGIVSSPGAYSDPMLSPDKRFVAVAKEGDIWIIDVNKNTESRLTFDPAEESAPIWSPDGKRIAFASARNGVANLYQKDAGGVGQEELLFESDHPKQPLDWSPDGRHILFADRDLKTGLYSLWVLSVNDRKTESLGGSSNSFQARFSPDGHWIAYTERGTALSRVYVQSFPTAATKYQISDSGSQALWRPDGKELFYLDRDRGVMAVDITMSKDGGFKAGMPHRLFGPLAAINMLNRSSWDVSADGQKFLVNPVYGDIENPKTTITVVLNWMAHTN